LKAFRILLLNKAQQNTEIPENNGLCNGKTMELSKERDGHTYPPDPGGGVINANYHSYLKDIFA